MVKTIESMTIEVVRLLILAAPRADIAQITITVAEDVAVHLNNKKRRELARLEDQGKMVVQVVGAKGVSPEYLSIDARDPDGREVKFSAYGP
jgi:ribonuclease E